MLRCKEVARALADHRYWELPWYKRMGMRIHVSLCFVCGRTHRQVILMQRLVRDYLAREADDPPAAALGLSPDSRARIRRALQPPSR
jgi:hypothetical protein